MERVLHLHAFVLTYANTFADQMVSYSIVDDCSFWNFCAFKDQSIDLFFFQVYPMEMIVPWSVHKNRIPAWKKNATENVHADQFNRNFLLKSVK